MTPPNNDCKTPKPKRGFASISALIILLCINGCATQRTVIVNDGSDVVRIGKNVKGSVTVWRDGQWMDGGTMVFPEGWYVTPGPKDLP